MENYKEDLEHGMNEFVLQVYNNKKINNYYRDVIKTGLELDAKGMFNVLWYKFYQDWQENNITRELTAYNGNVEKLEKFKDFEARFNEDYEELRKELSLDEKQKTAKKIQETNNIQILLHKMGQEHLKYQDAIRTLAIEYQNLAGEQNMYWSDVADIQNTILDMINDFDELKEELKENGII